MESKLISCTDFVLRTCKNENEVDISTNEKHIEQSFKELNLINAYANFLKRTIELGMFIPCDKEGNVLEHKSINLCQDLKEWAEYQEAKDRVLFEGFGIISFSGGLECVINKDCQVFSNHTLGNTGWFACSEFETIEDLIPYDLTLTEKAIKQIGA